MMLLTSKYEKYHSGNYRTAVHCAFSFQKGNKPPNIVQSLENVYEDRAMKRMQVYFWIAEVRRGREDFSDEDQPGGPPDIGLDEVLVHRSEAESHMTARKIADSPRISPQTVINHLQDGLGMKCFHLRQVLHTLTEVQKSARVLCPRDDSGP
jgi:hypothetical protein